MHEYCYVSVKNYCHAASLDGNNTTTTTTTTTKPLIPNKLG
jgi:hypothetical protein